MGRNNNMAKFKISNLECKFGMTVEVDKRWVRVDRGITLDNVDPSQDVLVKEIREAFAKAQQLCVEDVQKTLKGVAK